MWNPLQYNKFDKERHRPALELISRIPDMLYKSVIDLGCGDGAITQTLYDKYKPERTIGLDGSASMLEQAKQNSVAIDWQTGDIRNFNGKYDLVFSNAALQWVDNHSDLFVRLETCVNKVLAVQMPNNFDYPSHVLLRETISENAIFAKKLSTLIRVRPVFSKSEYFRILCRYFSELDIWETSYLQQLSGTNPVLEWVRGTALVPIRENLTADEYEQFEGIYSQKLAKAYPILENGTTLFPFSRIFIIARK